MCLIYSNLKLLRKKDILINSQRCIHRPSGHKYNLEMCCIWHWFWTWAKQQASELPHSKEWEHEIPISLHLLPNKCQHGAWGFWVFKISLYWLLWRQHKFWLICVWLLWNVTAFLAAVIQIYLWLKRRWKGGKPSALVGNYMVYLFQSTNQTLNLSVAATAAGKWQRSP